MRIISGRFRGRRLPSPRGRTVRPTTERVREAVFSTIGAAIEAIQVLDLFAGTGAFGFEALSRGASRVVFVDKNRKVAGIIAETASLLGVKDQVKVMVMEAFKAINELQRAKNRFGIIFVDPPYSSKLLQSLVFDPFFQNLFEEDGLLVMESEAQGPELNVPDMFSKQFTGRYGDTSVKIFCRKMGEL